MGGKSSEHDVSLVSAKTVIENIDKDLYNVIMVGITKDGQWKLVDRLDHLEDGFWVNSKTSAYICPDTGRNGSGAFRVSSNPICRMWRVSFCMFYG